MSDSQAEGAGTDAATRVVAWASVSIDGFTSGQGGAQHDQGLYEHARQEQTSAYFEDIWRGASTAVLGRTNYEGFFAVCDDAGPDHAAAHA